MKLKFHLCITFLLAGFPLLAQQDSLKSLTRKFDNYSVNSFQEKIFVHTDRQLYLTGESMWFSIFLVDAVLHQPDELSKVVYLELISKDNLSVTKTKVAVNNGRGSGSLFLPSSLQSGQYVLIAYTQWMRNFSPDGFFRQPVTIVNPFVKLSPPAIASASDFDIQFFPEGGNLVDGIKSTVAFRVVGKDGRGINFKGALLDDKKDTVAHFSPLHFGLGQFTITPSVSQHYQAVITKSKGQKILAPFPVVQESGFSLHVDDSGDHLLVDVYAKLNDVSLMNQWVYLLTESKMIRLNTLVQPLNNGSARFQINKSELREGVNRITLFTKDLRPVGERLYFKPIQRKLKIEITSAKQSYTTRQKVTVNLSAVSDKLKASSTALSLSAARLDSMDSNESGTIENYLALTSELKGHVESPDYYLRDNVDALAVDNLMLTQGWSRYRWDDILKGEKAEMKFIPELGSHVLSGKMLDGKGKPAAGVNVYLSIPGKDIRLYLARSKADGTVHFDVQNLVGERKIIVQGNSATDSAFRFELTDHFTENHGSLTWPEFQLSEKVRDQLTRRSLSMQLQNVFEPHATVRANQVDSIPFYGKANEKYLLDDYTRFPTMEEVMREYVKGVMVRKRRDGFHFLTLDGANNTLFRNDPLVLLDGVPVFDVDRIMAYDPRKVRQLDVITKPYYLGHIVFDGVASYTTYNGDLIDYSPEHATVFFTDGIQPVKEFFSPKYETPSQQESRLPDRRHLLFWTPQLTTAADGKAVVEFYTSDVTGHFRITVQGLSIEGKPGAAFFDFKVVH
ncbi:MAG: hypothetical protein JSS79_03100 [Bacteroidetes bacterium]|nr:hypothetical protein [Bacteroidota bacterium]